MLLKTCVKNICNWKQATILQQCFGETKLQGEGIKTS